MNGSIRASFGETSWEGEAAFETVNGSIALDVPESVNADVEIRTTNGRITRRRRPTCQSTRRARPVAGWKAHLARAAPSCG